MAGKSTVSVRIRGQEFRIRSDDDEESLQRVAGYLDDTMKTVERRDVALLTALNLARELVRIREDQALAKAAISPSRLSSLIDRVEAELALGGETTA